MEILYGILAALAAAIIATAAALCLRACAVKRKRTASDSPRKSADDEKLRAYIASLSRLIECKTVADGRNEAAFERFCEILREEFPLLHSRAELKVFGSGCLVYRISGKNAERNVMLMSHHDVVEAEGEWKHPPFSGTVADGRLWGRGTVDTKTPLFAELSAVEELLSEGFGFEGVNLYIASSNNEEICGDGIPCAVEYFKGAGIRFDSVLDEGGAIVSGMMPGVKRKSAMVAVHEKGRHTFLCSAATTDKGHLGLNSAKSNVIDRMSAFISEVKSAKLFKAGFYPEVEEMFLRHAPYMSFPFRLLFANFGLFRGFLLKVLPQVSAQAGGMLGTTMCFTSIEGAGATPQIQAKEVTATAFFRCVREEDLRREFAEFKKIAEKYGIGTEPRIVDYCRPFSAAQPQFATLERVLNSNFPDVIVSPFLLTAGTDARHFTDIADCILRFAPIDLDREQFASVHNPNENITVSNVGECVRFYKDYVKEVCRS